MSKTGGYVIMASGVAVIVLGSIGAVSSGGGEPVDASSGPTAATEATAATGSNAATSATGPSGTTSPGSIAPEVESPEVFLADFGAAIREGDAGFLFARLHPAVLAFYGDQQCRAQIRTFSDPNADLGFVSSRGPATFQWMVDGQTIPVEDVLDVKVEFATANGPDQRRIHLGIVEGQLHWFTDCGEPA